MCFEKVSGWVLQGCSLAKALGLTVPGVVLGPPYIGGILCPQKLQFTAVFRSFPWFSG